MRKRPLIARPRYAIGKNHTKSPMNISPDLSPVTGRSPYRSFMTPFGMRTPKMYKTEVISVKEPRQTALLSRIKSRASEKSVKVSPKLAHSVLKLYFLPYFEEKSKLDSERQRVLGFGTKLKTRTNKNYARLSDILRTSLIASQKQLEEMRSKLSQIQHEKSIIDSELILYKQQISLAESNKSASSSHISIYTHSVKPKYSHQSLVKRLAKAEKAAEDMIADYFSLQRTVNMEKHTNSSLLTNSEQHQFWHSLYQMISQVCGETLKGIYYTLTNLLKDSHLESVLLSIFSSSKSLAWSISALNETQLTSFSVSAVQLKGFMSRSSKLAQTRAQILKDLKSYKHSVIDHIDHLGQKHKLTVTENEDLKSEVRTKEKQLFDFSIEYENVQEKLRDAQALMSSVNLELICKVCNMNYFEEDNFNWSCCVHLSEWSGSMYWCCGGNFKESIGCQKRKHEQRTEEGEENEEAKELFVVKDKEVLKFCSNCKEIGHLSHQCYTDPNQIVWKIIDGKKKTLVRDVNKRLSAHTKKKSRKDWFEDIFRIKTAASQCPSPELSCISDTSRSFITDKSRSSYSSRATTPTFKSFH